MAPSAIYLKLMEAHWRSPLDLEPIEWLEKVSRTSPVRNHWKMILGLQLEILLYVRSLRESNFQPYVSALACFIKWLFAMDHYKYAWWCSVDLFNLWNLEFIARSLYEEFNTGNFSFDKTIQIFQPRHQIKLMRKQWGNKRTWWSNSSIEQTWFNWSQWIGNFWSRTCTCVK